jgi:hypothetical protein
MKQTAVEWLAEQMLHPDNHNPYIEKALEMEKEQMMDCYLKADVFPRKYEFEEYYKETYKQD